MTMMSLKPYFDGTAVFEKPADGRLNRKRFWNLSLIHRKEYITRQPLYTHVVIEPLEWRLFISQTHK